MYKGSIRGPATARKASQRAGIFPCNARSWQAQSCSGSCTLARAPAVFIDRHASSNHGRPRAHCKSAICQFSGCQTYEDASIQALSDTHNCTLTDVYCSPHDDSYSTDERNTSCQSDNAWDYFCHAELRCTSPQCCDTWQVRVHDRL